MAAERPQRPIHGKLNNYERFFEQVYNVFNGGTDRGGFLNGVNQPGHMDNVHAQVVTPGVANTEFSITHNLNRIPSGLNIIRKTATCDIFDSGTAWTITQIFLKSPQTNVTITVEIY